MQMFIEIFLYVASTKTRQRIALFDWWMALFHYFQQHKKRFEKRTNVTTTINFHIDGKQFSTNATLLK